MMSKLVNTVSAVTLIVASLLAASPAHSEDSIEFQINSAANELHAKSAASGSTPAATVVLPGRGQVQLFDAAKSEQLNVPVLNENAEAVRTVPVQVQSVTDFGNLDGVLVKSSEGVHAYLSDSSVAEPEYFQISPVAGKSGTHLATRATASEVAAAMKALGGGDFANDVLESAHTEPSLSVRSVVAPIASASSSDDTWREVKLVVVSSSDYSKSDSDSSIVSQIVTAIAAANKYYVPLRLKIVVSAVQIFRADTPNNPFGDAIQSFWAPAMLNQLKAIWDVVPQSRLARDAVAVFARSAYYGTTSDGETVNMPGLSWEKRSCVDPQLSYLFASLNNYPSYMSATGFPATVAHELGHVVGMSHDTDPSGEGSVMWPSYQTKPYGFSPKSIAQFEAYAGIGQPGGACLASISEQSSSGSDTSPERLISFAGQDVEKYQIAEGASFTKTFEVTGVTDGLQFAVSGLPAGAVFDAASKTLTYTPDYNVATAAQPLRSFTVTLEASSSGGQATKTVVLNVVNKNRAPSLAVSGSVTKLYAKRGSSVRFAVKATDPDTGDKAALKLLTPEVVSELRGTRSILLQSSNASFSWNLSKKALRGAYRFVFSATDASGARTQRAVTVVVQ